MFGIGLPELILIMGIALIVVGPEKLPGLAKTIAKQVLELKKAANLFKDSLQDEMGPDKSPDNKLPAGFSRPEDLAAAARESIDQSNERGADSTEENPDDPYKDADGNGQEKNTSENSDSEKA